LTHVCLTIFTICNWKLGGVKQLNYGKIGGMEKIPYKEKYLRMYKNSNSKARFGFKKETWNNEKGE